MSSARAMSRTHLVLVASALSLMPIKEARAAVDVIDGARVEQKPVVTASGDLSHHYSLAMQQVESDDPRAAREGRLNLQALCKDGHAVACVNLGLHYEFTPPLDSEKAGWAYSAACDLGSRYGCDLRTSLWMAMGDPRARSHLFDFRERCRKGELDVCGAYGDGLMAGATGEVEFWMSRLPYARACSQDWRWCLKFGSFGLHRSTAILTTAFALSFLVLMWFVNRRKRWPGLVSTTLIVSVIVGIVALQWSALWIFGLL